MIARTSLKTVWKCSISTRKVSKLPSCLETQQKRQFSSSCNNKNNSNNEKKKQEETVSKPSPQKAARVPDIPSFMPVVNIPVTELAHNAFYSLHRPLLGLSTPRPFLAGGFVGRIQKEDDDRYSEEALLHYLSKLRPFEPPSLDDTITKEDADKTICSTTTLTVEVDPSYFLNHNNNHDEIADYLTAMQEKLDLLYDERATAARKISHSTLLSKKKIRRSRKRKGFFEKN